MEDRATTALLRTLQKREENAVKATKAPEIKNWAPFSIVEVDRPEDFFEIPNKKTGQYKPGDIRGIICPIPESIILDEETIRQCYAAIEARAKTYTNYKDVINEIEFRTDKTGQLTEENTGLPKSLVDLGNLLSETFDRAIKTPNPRAPTTSFRAHSNNHTNPDSHRPTIIANPDGKGTIFYTQDIDGNYTGKRSLPEKSIAIFTGLHSAEPERMNRLGVAHTRHYHYPITPRLPEW